MLHLGEVEDKGHTGDEDEVEEAHGGKEVSHLSKVCTAQKHLEQHLDGETNINIHIDSHCYKHLEAVQKWFKLRSGLTL